MKHRLETVTFLASFAISMVAVAASESNKTRLNWKVETEYTPLCYNNTYFVAGKFGCEESAANATSQEERVTEIYGTDLVSRNISVSNDEYDYQINSVVLIYPKCLNDCTSVEEIKDQSQLVYATGMLISMPFLIATYIVYWLLPELRNIHGQTLLQHVGCLIATYGTLGAAGVELIPIQEVYFLCIIIALVVTFTFTASFFWLNVMCFDIWWSLRRLRSTHVSVKQGKRKKFVIYSLYAWGGALVLTSVNAIMDLFPGVSKDLIRPQFCVSSIWFHTDLAELLYFWGPVSIIIILNICLFISTARTIVRHKKSTTRDLKSSESRRHVDKEEQFGVYLKLFIVMGMSWSLEIVALIIDHTYAYVPIYYWYLSGLTNILQGIVIFVLFVLRKKTKNLLIKRLSCRFCPRGNLTNNDLSSVSRATTSEVPLRDVNLH